jgi:Zn finger protein HypA/HybF involved in hydrogenase expression
MNKRSNTGVLQRELQDVGVKPALLTNARDELLRDTPGRGAALELEWVAQEAICDQCGNKFQIDGSHYECDKCGSLRLSLRGVDELRLNSVKLQEE